VLAFPGGELSLGEIVLCPPVIYKDAAKYGITYQEAVELMFVHGLLHLVGYDHTNPRQEKRMKSKERHYLSAL
jgi:probable rRNA maturation factor